MTRLTRDWSLGDANLDPFNQSTSSEIFFLQDSVRSLPRPRPAVLTLSGYSAMVAWSADQDALLKKLCEQHTKEDGRVDWSAVVGNRHKPVDTEEDGRRRSWQCFYNTADRELVDPLAVAQQFRTRAGTEAVDVV
jgi:hypothetical protein